MISIVSLIMLVVFYKYMLIVLLMFELVVFNMTLIMGTVFSSMYLDFYLNYYLICSLCESVLGMSMVVLIVRYYGNDMYYFMNFFKLLW